MAVIDRKRGYIFVHVPKTGGTSICSTLRKDPHQPIHMPLREIDVRGEFTFGFVRNPWDRLVSLFWFIVQKKPDDPSYDPQQIEEAGFKHWLMHDRTFMGEDDKRGVALAPLQTRSQLWWVNGCNFIGRFERLGSDLNYAAILGKFRVGRLSKLNATVRKDYRKYYDDESREFVAHHFASDIDRFGYTFDAS